MKYAITIMMHLIFSYAIPVAPALLGLAWMRLGNPGWRQTIGAVMATSSLLATGVMYNSLFKEALASQEISDLVALLFAQWLYLITLVTYALSFAFKPRPAVS